jgi:hypothetical protein
MFLFTLLFQPYVLFLYYIHDMRGRPRWPAESRTTQGAPAPTGSLPSGCVLWFLAGEPGDPGLTAPNAI